MIAEVRNLVIGPDGGPPVVDGVSFAVAPGEIVGLVGRSGSGKTTAALTLLGHLRPGLRLRAGSVTVTGRDPFTHARGLRGHVVTHLAQDPAASLNPARRIGSLVADAVRTRAAGSAWREEVERLLAALDLPTDRAFLRRFPHQVSGGQAQRVALAIALAGDPRLVVFDEPTSALDALATETARELITTALRTRDIAAVLVSHDSRLVGELATSVVRLDRGRMTGAAPRPLPSPAPAPLASTAPLLSVRDLSARHGRHPAVIGVTLDLAPGGCLALVGPSGGGKSTIARCLVGLHEPTTGRITLDGDRLAGHHRHRTRPQRRAVQLVAQDTVGALNPRETVRAALTRAIRLADSPEKVSDLLERVRLPETVADRRPSALSGGERQRVTLARALAARPQVLVCDEITSALDPETGAAVLDLLTELRRADDLAVLLVTHDLDAVVRVADDVAVLAEGAIVETGRAGEILVRPTHPLTASLVRGWAPTPDAVVPAS